MKGISVAEHVRELILKELSDNNIENPKDELNDSVTNIQENKQPVKLELQKLLESYKKEKSGKQVSGTSEPNKSPFAEQSNAHNRQSVVPCKMPCVIIKEECVE